MDIGDVGTGYAPGRFADPEQDFTAFVRSESTALLRTAYLLTGNALHAEELVQDTLVRLYPKWQLVQAAESPLAYVRRSLTNGFVNHTRKASTRHESAVEYLPERVEDYDTITRLDDRDAIWSLLTTLPERQRAALVLRYFHDLPDEQIADTLDSRVGTVRSLISRGLATLRENVARGEASA